MKGRNTLILFICVVLLGLFIWVMEIERHRATRTFLEEITLFNIDSDSLMTLKFEYSNSVVECINDNGIWKTGGENGGRADVGIVNRVVSALNSLGKGTVITGEEIKARGIDASAFGFDHPFVRITAEDGSGRRVWLIGRHTPLGKMVYVKMDDTPEIYTITDRLLGMIPRENSEIRDRILFKEDPIRIRSVEIRGTGGFLQLIKDAEVGWRIQQPVSALADQTKIADFLDRLYRYRIEKFIADNVSDFAVYGLQDKTRQISLGATDGSVRTIILGDEIPDANGYVYARRADEASVYGVRKGLLDLLKFERDDFRDRRVLPVSTVDNITSVSIDREGEKLELKKQDDGWQVVKPVRWSASPEKVNKLLKTWVDAFIVEFNDFTESSETASLQNVKPVWTLTFGSVITDRTNSVYVLPDDGKTNRVVIRRNEEPANYVINLKDIPDELGDHLYYKDLSVLQLRRNNIQKVVIQTSYGTETIVKQPDGSFNAVTHESAEAVDSAALDRLLNVLSDLHACEYVAYNPADLSLYGLDSPSFTVHIGLSDREQIGYVLLIGKATESGYYAMVQGRDVVFIIDRKDASSLTEKHVIPAIDTSGN